MCNAHASELKEPTPFKQCMGFSGDQTLPFMEALRVAHQDFHGGRALVCGLFAVNWRCCSN